MKCDHCNKKCGRIYPIKNPNAEYGNDWVCNVCLEEYLKTVTN